MAVSMRSCAGWDAEPSLGLLRKSLERGLQCGVQCLGVTRDGVGLVLCGCGLVEISLQGTTW